MLEVTHPLWDPVSGQRLAALCDGEWRNDGRKDREQLPSSGLIYVKTDDVHEFFHRLNDGYYDRKYVLLTHNSDLAVRVGNDFGVDIAVIYEYSSGRVRDGVRIPKQIKHWFCLNYTGDHRDYITPTPIFMVNQMWPAGNAADWIHVCDTVPKKKTADVLCCFSVLTNRRERQECYDFFKTRSYATVIGGKTHMDVAPIDYMTQMRRHRYIICPRGNGPDCHRAWEACYVNSTPVMLYDSMPFDPPHAFYVNKWSDMDTLVEDDFARGDPSKAPLLNLDYWRPLFRQFSAQERIYESP